MSLQRHFSAACNERALRHLESKPRPALVKGAPRCLIYKQLKMLQNFESVFTAFFSPICLLARMELRGKGLGCHCGFTHLQLFHAPFFDILWIPKDPQATPWETTAWKDKVKKLFFMYHWSSLILQENREEENHRLWFHCKKSCLIATTKVFLRTKLDKSEVVLQWAHHAHRTEHRALQMHPAPFKAKTVQPTGSGQPFQQEQLYRLVHHSSVSLGNGRQ